MTDLMVDRGVAAGLLSAMLMLPAAASADAVLDGTTGSTGSFSGDFEIPAAVGRQEGGNLFHSFGRFSVLQGESATFTGPAGIDNVISRVTGGEVSTINGQLASTIPGADFFFLNPAGVVFGPEASLDIDGSFHVSTADELRFADGTRFSASDPDASSFTIAAPEAFGFLGAQPAPIEVDRGQLVVPEGKKLSLVGGDITVTAGNQGTASGGSAGRLVAAAGTIEVVALDAPGEVVPGSGGASGGRIELTDQATVDAGGSGGGNVWIRAGRLVLENQSAIADDNSGIVDSGGEISISAERVRVDTAASITTSSSGPGSAGRLAIAADDLLVANGGAIGSTAIAEGDAGPIDITVGALTVAEGSGVFTSSFPGASGGGGDIRVEAKDVALDGGFIATSKLGTGALGRLTVRADDSVSIRGAGGAILAANISDQPSGPVSIHAGRLEVVEGAGVLTNTLSSGAGGDIEVVAGELEIASGGTINATSLGPGRAGSVSIEADALEVSGTNSRLAVDSGSVVVPDAGDAGALTVRADELTVRNGGRISSDTYGTGNAGAVTVKTERLRLAGGDLAPEFGISSDAQSGSSGAAGSIRVVAREATITGNGQIRSSTFGAGDAGRIRVEADQLLVRDGNADMTPTGIISDAGAGSSGDGGGITIRSDQIEILGGAQIRAVTFSTGDAGAIDIKTDDLMMKSEGFTALFTAISSSAAPGASGDAGTVRLVADGQVEVADGAQIRTETSGPGDAGSIQVVAREATITGNGQIQSSTLDAGDAGRIRVKADQLLVRDGNDDMTPTGILSDAGTGSSGDGGGITVRADQIEILRGAQIRAVTFSGGDAGAIDIETQNLTMRSEGFIALVTAISSSAAPGSSGDAGTVRLVADGQVEVADGAQIRSLTFGEGDAGAVSVDGGSLRILAEDQSAIPTGILSSAEAESSGDAGEVTVRADAIEMLGGQIRALTFSTGAAGGIEIDTGNLAISTGGFTAILTGVLNSAEPGASGDAGRIRVVADGTVSIADGGQVSSATAGSGSGGDIVLRANRLELDNGLITTLSSSNAPDAGAAGAITIIADALRLRDAASISAQTAAAEAGDIDVSAGELVEVRESAITTSVAGGQGSGGNIFIDPEFAVIDSGRIVAQAREGAGGNIRIVADNFFTTPGTVIDASSDLGIDGTVEIDAPDVDLTSELAVLSTAFIDVSGLLRESCAAQSSDQTSSFVTAGSQGLVPDPAAPLAGAYAARAPRDAGFQHWTSARVSDCHE